MSLPRSLLDAPLADLDLELRSGAWPEGLAGEVFVSTSERATAPIHGFFGDGVMIRLSLTPGTHGAPPGRFAWRHRRARHADPPPPRGPSRRLAGERPRLVLPVRVRQRGQHRAPALGRSPVRHVGRGPPRRGRPRLAAVPRRGRPARLVGRRRLRRAGPPAVPVHGPPRGRPRARLPVEHALAPAHRRGARRPVGRRRHHGAPLAPRRRDAAPVDAHRRPDPRLARARRLCLPGRPGRGARRRRTLGDDVHRRARLARPQGRPGGRAPTARPWRRGPCSASLPS